jgi:hypothetical protein
MLHMTPATWRILYDGSASGAANDERPNPGMSGAMTLKPDADRAAACGSHISAVSGKPCSSSTQRRGWSSAGACTRTWSVHSPHVTLRVSAMMC